MKEKEQKPQDQKEWTIPEVEGDRWSWFYVCGECHGQINWHDQQCRHCGRWVNWNG